MMGLKKHTKRKELEMTQTEKDKALKKVEIAIDKMIDLQQDFDLNTMQMSRILDSLNSLYGFISSK